MSRPWRKYHRNKNRYRAAPVFKWKSSSGHLTPRQMKTSHLFYSLRLIFNSYSGNVSVPTESARTMEFDPWEYPDEYLAQAVKELYKELETRERPGWMDAQLDAMRMHYLAEVETPKQLTQDTANEN